MTVLGLIDKGGEINCYYFPVSFSPPHALTDLPAFHCVNVSELPQLRQKSFTKSNIQKSNLLLIPFKY